MHPSAGQWVGAPVASSPVPAIKGVRPSSALEPQLGGHRETRRSSDSSEVKWQYQATCQISDNVLHLDVQEGFKRGTCDP